MHDSGVNEKQRFDDFNPPMEQRSRPPRQIANCDQESWVKTRIKTAIEMALAIRSIPCVGAEEGMRKHAIDGIANGAAIEIIRTLGMEPEFTNLRK